MHRDANKIKMQATSDTHKTAVKFLVATPMYASIAMFRQTQCMLVCVWCIVYNKNGR